MSTRLLQISLKACSLQAVPVHSLCLMQTSHYTPKSSPPSSRGANLPWQSTLVPAQMGKCFQSVIINSWASQCVTWMIQNELTMNMHHICGDLSGVQRQTGDTRLKNCFELPLSLSLLQLGGWSQSLWLHTPLPFHTLQSDQFLFLLRLSIVPTIKGNILMEEARMK